MFDPFRPDLLQGKTTVITADRIERCRYGTSALWVAREPIAEITERSELRRRRIGHVRHLLCEDVELSQNGLPASLTGHGPAD